MLRLFGEFGLSMFEGSTGNVEYQLSFLSCRSVWFFACRPAALNKMKPWTCLIKKWSIFWNLWRLLALPYLRWSAHNYMTLTSTRTKSIMRALFVARRPPTARFQNINSILDVSQRFRWNFWSLWAIDENFWVGPYHIKVESSVRFTRPFSRLQQSWIRCRNGKSKKGMFLSFASEIKTINQIYHTNLSHKSSRKFSSSKFF